MKKVLLTSIIAFLVSQAANSQISRGSYLLGGSLGFTTGTLVRQTGESSIKTFSVSPQAGYSFKENNVLGLRLQFNSNINSSSNFPDNQAYSYGAGLFYRLYKGLSNKFYLFGEAGTNYVYSKYSGTGVKTTGHSVALNVFPGITYALSKRFHLEAILNNLLNMSYGTSHTINTSTSSPDESKSRGFTLDSNINPHNPITIGFRFVLGK